MVWRFHFPICKYDFNTMLAFRVHHEKPNAPWSDCSAGWEGDDAVAERVGIQRGWKEEGGGSASSIAHWRRRREVPVRVVHQPEEDAPFNGWTISVFHIEPINGWTIYVFHIEPFNGWTISVFHIEPINGWTISVFHFEFGLVVDLLYYCKIKPC